MNNQKSIREQFEKDFSPEFAEKIFEAAVFHGNGVNNTNLGSDPFKWALLICIGYDCFKVEPYRKDHGISEYSFDRIKKWIVENADLGTHDGDCDYLAAFSGAYNDYIKHE